MSAHQALRNPEGGKAHRQLGSWGTTVCRPDSLSGSRLLKTLTQEVPVEQTAPEDRCKRCFPEDVP